MSVKGLDFSLKSVTSGVELPTFDPTLQKKKKKKTLKTETEPDQAASDDLDFDFGKKKKKKQSKPTVVPPDTTTSTVTIAEVDGDYDYFALLQRVCSNLGKVAETSGSLSLPELIVEPEGTTKTVWRNIARVGAKLNRDVDHIRKFDSCKHLQMLV